MSSTINSDLQSISEGGKRNLVKFNTSQTQLLTISLSNTPSNYPIVFENMLFSFKNKYQYTYLNTYIALYFRTPKLPEKHTHNPWNELPSLIKARSLVS